MLMRQAFFNVALLKTKIILLLLLGELSFLISQFCHLSTLKKKIYIYILAQRFICNVWSESKICLKWQHALFTDHLIYKGRPQVFTKEMALCFCHLHSNLCSMIGCRNAVIVCRTVCEVETLSEGRCKHLGQRHRLVILKMSLNSLPVFTFNRLSILPEMKKKWKRRSGRKSQELLKQIKEQ